MSTQYSGNPANVSDSLTRTITGCANNGSGKIRVTTSASHLFSTFDLVIVTGVTGTTEANGTWVITVIDSTHLDLVGSTFTHAYVSGGSVTDHSLTPAATLPSDGEQLTAATVLAAFQLLLDRTQFLATEELASPVVSIVAPTPFNISYGQNWAVGDDGTGAATGSRVVKTFVDTTALLFDLTPYLARFNGRSITQLAATFAVGQSHSAVPAVLPTMRLYRTQSLTSLGVAPAADQSLLAAVDAPFPTPGSGALYYSSGHLQSWNLTPDQNNVIDTTRRYYAVLIDENGANTHTLNAYFGFKLTVN